MRTPPARRSPVPAPRRAADDPRYRWPRPLPRPGRPHLPARPRRLRWPGRPPPPGTASQHGHGLLWAAAAGVLWGSYFVPAQWAGTSAQVSNFPLAAGMLTGGLALALSRRAPVRLPMTGAAANLAAGALFGIGNLALLGLVSRVGTGAGFTIGQLSLLVNASIGIWAFKVPPPGSRAAKLAMAGILIAGSGGVIIGALR